MTKMPRRGFVPVLGDLPAAGEPDGDAVRDSPRTDLPARRGSVMTTKRLLLIMPAAVIALVTACGSPSHANSSHPASSHPASSSSHTAASRPAAARLRHRPRRAPPRSRPRAEARAAAPAAAAAAPAAASRRTAAGITTPTTAAALRRRREHLRRGRERDGTKANAYPPKPGRDSHGRDGRGDGRRSRPSLRRRPGPGGPAAPGPPVTGGPAAPGRE